MRSASRKPHPSISTAKVSPYKKSFGPYAPEIYRAPFSYPFRGTGRLTDTLAWIETSVDPGQIACVVVEPIAGQEAEQQNPPRQLPPAHWSLAVQAPPAVTLGWQAPSPTPSQ